MEPFVKVPLSVLSSDELTDGDKLLYGLVSSLSNNGTGCWATNGYMATTLKKHPMSISSSLNKLRRAGLLTFNGRGKRRIMKTADKRFRVEVLDGGRTIRFTLPREPSAEERMLNGRLKRLPLHRASPETVRVFNHWQQERLGTDHKNPKTKTVEEALYAVENRVLKQYSLDDVLLQMDKFKAMSADLKNRYSIHNFFVPSRYLKITEGKSLFQCVADGSLLCRCSRHLPEDRHPEITGYMRKYYSVVWLGRKDNGHWSAKQEGDFRKAAVRMAEYMEGDGRVLRETFYDQSECTYKDYVKYLFRALEDRYGSATQVSTGNLCSNYTFSDVLPKFVKHVMDGE